jgi:hypothetical protein
VFTKIVLVQFIQDRVVVWCHMLTLFWFNCFISFFVDPTHDLYCFSMNLFVSYRCGLSIALSWMAD